MSSASQPGASPKKPRRQVKQIVSNEELLAGGAGHGELSQTKVWPRAAFFSSAILSMYSAEKRLRDLFMQAPAAIAVVKGSQHTYELANPLYQKLFNRTEQQLLGKTMREVFPEVAGQGVYELMDSVFASGKPYVASEFPVVFDRMGNGSMETGYFNFVVQPIGGNDGNTDSIFIHAFEVTEQIVVQKRLADSEQQLRFMAESLPQKIFTIMPDGRIGYVNSQWEEYTGIPLERLMAEPHLRQEMVHPDDVARTNKAWRAAFKREKPLEHEYRLRQKDGAYRWHISRVNPMKDADGTVTMWIGSSTDIDDMKYTAERKHELEIETATLTKQSEQLMQLNQAKDEFISLASHQLRTPATGVKQYIGMLLQGYVGELTDDQKAFLRTAYESNERQIRIVNDLLQVAQVDAGKVRLQKSMIDLVGLIDNILDEQASKFLERDQHLVFRPVMKKLVVRADEDRIRMVLENIIDNAGKYSPSHKIIAVRLSSRKDTVLIAIRDQGVGMAAGDIEKIFNKFSRLDNPLSIASEGSGLGLYWAKKIIDLHGGKIRVRSVAGKGSTFTIVLPLK